MNSVDPTEQLVPLHKAEFERAELSREMLTMIIMLNNGGDRVLLMENELKDLVAYRMLVARLEGLNIQVSKQLLILILVMAENPAEISVYVHCLWHLLQSRPGIPLTLEDFLLAFGGGFPTEAAMDAFWQAQKRDGYNLVDCKHLYEVQ